MSATVAMIVMEPALGEMEVAMLPALDRRFARFTLPMNEPKRGAAALA
jgi:isopenicillin-N N-acyltransferase-like protein